MAGKIRTVIELSFDIRACAPSPVTRHPSLVINICVLIGVALHKQRCSQWKTRKIRPAPAPSSGPRDDEECPESRRERTMSDGEQALLALLRKLDVGGGRPPAAPGPAAPNPFARRPRSRSLSSVNFGAAACECARRNRAVIHTASFKKPHRRVLREPLLRSFRCPHEGAAFGQCAAGEGRDFRSIVDGCERLKLEAQPPEEFQSASFAEARQAAPAAPKAEAAAVGASCARQARMNAPPPCDVTIDELASYFETFVHIPKKMSSMAEMMYI